MEKPRIRTEQELNNQAKGLKELRDLFNDLNIQYFISGGTLLGIIRDGDFIKWDWDAELDFRAEDFIPRRKEIISELKKRGFTIEDRNRSLKNYKLNVVKYGSLYDLLVYNKVGEERQRMRSKIPDRLFKPGCYVTLRGEKYQALNPPEDYLTYNYGDWETPKRTMDKGIYVTRNSRMKISIIDYIRNFFQI